VDEKYFPVVAARLMFGFYINWSYLAAVLSRAKVGPGPIMCVVETQTGWTRSEHNPEHSVRRDEGRPFFCSTIYGSGNHLAMPVQLLGSVGVIVNFDRGRLTFSETQ
jgi:hypothetical protein